MDSDLWSFLLPEAKDEALEDGDAWKETSGQHQPFAWPSGPDHEGVRVSPTSENHYVHEPDLESWDSGYVESYVDKIHSPDHNWAGSAIEHGNLTSTPVRQSAYDSAYFSTFLPKGPRIPIPTELDFDLGTPFIHTPQDLPLEVAREPQLITPTNLESHKADGTYVCCFCPPSRKVDIRHFDDFKQHLSYTHSYSQNTLHCPNSNCSRVFLERDLLKRHMGVHRENVEIAELHPSCKEEQCPSACPVCQAPTHDWEVFFGCLKEHCLTDPKRVSAPSLLPPGIESPHTFLSELEPSIEHKRKRTGDEELFTKLLSPNGAQRQRLIDPCDASADHATFSQQRQSSASLEYSPSASDSRDTDITRPDPEDDSIDAEIIGNRNLGHILDPSRYFGELDQLEIATARVLGMGAGPLIAPDTVEDFITHLTMWEAALGDLQSRGFCGPSMSILVEKQGRENIAEAFPVPLEKVKWLLSGATRFDRNALDLQAKDWIQTMLNLNEADFSSLNPASAMRTLCSILSVGLVSFSGSHVCPFDVNIWSQQVEDIPIGLGEYAFSPRKLACLDDFIGGPAWVLGKVSPQETPNSPCIPQGILSALPGDGEQVQRPRQGTDGSLEQDSGIKVCLSVQEFDELWGPISLVGGAVDRGLAIRTERGFISPLPYDQQTELLNPRKQTIECHWTTEIPQHIYEGRIDGYGTGVPISINATSRLLIGTGTDTEIGLVVNEKCKSSIASFQQQIACRLQYPGTCKSKYVKDGLDFQFGGGQYITGGLVRKYKRMPKRTLKAMLIEDCQRSDTKLVPLLGLRVGLEVSACTGNAQRVTLWDALRLFRTGVQGLENPPYCEHKIGDRHCISSCWTRCHSNDDIDSFGDQPAYGSLLSGPQARRIIINSILALEHTGLDSEGSLQVAWPFSDIPANCPVLPSTPKEVNNWFRIVKETRETSSFPVFSQRCLEFPDKSLVRSCSAPCRTAHIKPLQTILSTQILKLATDSPILGLLEGARLLVGDAHLIVTKTVKDRLPIVATVSMNPLSPLRFRLREILPDAPTHGFKENIRPDISVGLSVPVYVH